MSVRSSSSLSSLQQTPSRLGTCRSHLAGRGAGADDSDSVIGHTGGFLLISPDSESLRGRGTAEAPFGSEESEDMDVVMMRQRLFGIKTG